jgi:hypothetical protein
MSAIDITWDGGEHAFRLGIAELRAIQQKCDAGPAWVLARLANGQWMVDDVIQPIRLGLEGGGMAKAEATRLVKNHVEDRPLTASVMTAQAVLMAALYGVEDDPVGEKEAATEKPNRRRGRKEAAGGSASSTEPAQP